MKKPVEAIKHSTQNMAAKILKNKVNKHPNHGMDTSSEESYRPQMKLPVDLSSNKLSGQQGMTT